MRCRGSLGKTGADRGGDGECLGGGDATAGVLCSDVPLPANDSAVVSIGKPWLWSDQTDVIVQRRPL